MACSDELCGVRIQIGDFDEPYELKDAVINYHLDSYPDLTKIQRMYCASIDSLKSLLRSFSLQGSRLREREGSVEVEEYRNEKIPATRAALRDLLLHPPPGIAPPSFEFGGTSCDEVRRVEDDSDSPGVGTKLGWFNDVDYRGEFDNPPDFEPEDFRGIT